jgi:hypothetical protein
VAAKKLSIPQVIPLGKRGKLHGVIWEAIGFMKRRDVASGFSWVEYLLFNPVRGFRWLTESEGHWNYVIPLKERPNELAWKSGSDVLHHLGKNYRLFHRGQAVVDYVVGEFYWRVYQDETVQAVDYVCPPEMLSIEHSAGEVTYSMGEYLDGNTVKTAFDIKGPMPYARGVAPNQLWGMTPALKEILKIWGFFVASIFMIQLLIIIFSGNKVAYSGVYSHNAEEASKSKVSPSFELTGGTSGVEFEISAPVVNQWFEAQIDLVDEVTGEVYEIEQGVEFYQGNDSDGYWREGSQFQKALLPSIPGGTYHLNLESSSSVNSLDYSVTVRRGVVPMSNFLFAFFLISIVPFLLWRRGRNFEIKRWSQSDFSPYYTEES